MSHLRSQLVPETVIVDYDAGNLRSVQRACAEVGLAAEICADPSRLRRADRIIFPGVGQAGSAMATLNRTGLGEALRQRLGEGFRCWGFALDYKYPSTTRKKGTRRPSAFWLGKRAAFSSLTPP